MNLPETKKYIKESVDRPSWSFRRETIWEGGIRRLESFRDSKVYAMPWLVSCWKSNYNKQFMVSSTFRIYDGSIGQNLDLKELIDIEMCSTNSGLLSSIHSGSETLYLCEVSTA